MDEFDNTSSMAETSEEGAGELKRLEEERRLETLMILLAVVAIISPLVVYGDAFSIFNKVVSTYEDIWEILFPR